eukprot:m.161830 g.161830  ORF g.161830 m.161830 type:complete len:151 (+) comp12116_c0_seq1:1-453(+)
MDSEVQFFLVWACPVVALFVFESRTDHFLACPTQHTTKTHTMASVSNLFGAATRTLPGFMTTSPACLAAGRRWGRLDTRVPKARTSRNDDPPTTDELPPYMPPHETFGLRCPTSNQSPVYRPAHKIRFRDTFVAADYSKSSKSTFGAFSP